MNKQNGHIFISYAREDRGRVAILAKLLADEGWSVWWDRVNLPAGQKFQRVIARAIQDASCVLVCWSEAAINSDWVIDEANEAKKKNKYLPVLLEAVEVPFGFRGYHYIDLTEWDNKASQAAYQRLKAELTKIQPLTKSDVHTYKPEKSNISKPKANPANVQKLIDRLNNPLTTPKERLTIGDELANLGDPRPGVGLNEKGQPDIDWVKIPGGKFLYGEKKETLEVESFFIARYLITNAQYQTFIKDGGYDNDRWWQGLSERITEPEKPGWDQSNRPRETVSWYEAIAFCRWLSEQLGCTVQLPTEEQWERAARGDDGREYPWGNEYVSGYANVDETINKDGSHYLVETSAVGLYPSGGTPESILDLAGNIWEWCLNEYGRPENTALEGDGPRVLRGGSWLSFPDNVRASVRDRSSPVGRRSLIGFRVVCSSLISH